MTIKMFLLHLLEVVKENLFHWIFENVFFSTSYSWKFNEDADIFSSKNLCKIDYYFELLSQNFSQFFLLKL